jgi:adenine deaminase
VIEAIDGQLVTNCILQSPKIEKDEIVSDPTRDLLKMVLVDRYNDGAAAVCFVKNFGLQRGAIASTVSHDSHNIIAVGANDHDLARSINALIEVKGGISVASHLDTTIEVLPLPIAGLMSDQDGYQVAEAYSRIDAAAKALGSKLTAPFMTLSFMALTVIPALKLGPDGLFDVNQFKYVPLSD